MDGAVGAVTCVAAVLVGAGIWSIVAGGPPRANAFDIGYVAVVLAVSARMTLHIRIGGTRIPQSLTDTAIMLGLIVLPWPWLVLVIAPSVAVGKAIAGLGRKGALFSTAKDVVLAGVGAGVGTALGLAQPFRPTLERLPALLVVAVAIIAAAEVLVLPVVAFATGHRLRDVFRRDWTVRLGGSLVRLLIAIVAGYLFRFDQRLAVATPLLLIGIQLAYATRAQERADRTAWQRLARIADALGATHEYAVRRAAVTGAVELFACDEVELEVHTLGQPPSLMRGGHAGITYVGTAGRAPATAGTVISSPLDSQGVAHPTRGELRLRFAGAAMFSERERDMLRALAAATGTALRKTTAVAEAGRMATSQAHAATHDELTKLANRRHLLEFAAGRTGTVGLIVLDINQFKQVNDALDESAGDRVIVEIASRLAESTHSADGTATAAMAARIGGDEFALLLTGIAKNTEALARARQVIARLAEPIVVDGHPMEISATAGVAVGDDVGVGELLRRADVALHNAKYAQQPIALYRRQRDTADPARLSLSADLVTAVTERQFVIAFQPIVDLASGEVISTEALARWHHPRQGRLAPNRFLGAIERSGLLAPFTADVLDQALSGARMWYDAGFPLPVAVNISPRSLLDPAFPDSIPAALDAHDLPPEALTIELTETLTLSQLEVVDDVLHALRELGVMLALDDFGTGYSSLAMIARVPVHELKVDRTFVAGMAGATEAAIVRSTVELGRSLDLLVVAEGVESAEQRERLWSIGCPAGQGHLFARPMDPARLVTRLRQGHDGVPGRLAAPMHPDGDVIRLPAPAGPHAPARRAAVPAPRPRTRSGRADSRTASTE